LEISGEPADYFLETGARRRSPTAFFAAGALCIAAAMLILSVPKPSARRFVAATPLPARS
jgi:hypothetical protein